jgi:hypothetical protein
MLAQFVFAIICPLTLADATRDRAVECSLSDEMLLEVASEVACPAEGGGTHIAEMAPVIDVLMRNGR